MSKNLGVAMTRCFFCNEGDRLLLNTKLTPSEAWKVEKMNNCVIDMEPCVKCRDYMVRGVLLITIDSAKSDPGWEKEKMPARSRRAGADRHSPA